MLTAFMKMYFKPLRYFAGKKPSKGEIVDWAIAFSHRNVLDQANFISLFYFEFYNRKKVLRKPKEDEIIAFLEKQYSKDYNLILN